MLCDAKIIKDLWKIHGFYGHQNLDCPWNTVALARTFGPASENANLVSWVQTSRSRLLLLLFRTYSDRSTLWAGWDELLLETEADAACHADVAGVISRAVSRPLLEKTFHMKIQSRKVFAHRESYETILSKTEEMLLKVRLCRYTLEVFIFLYEIRLKLTEKLRNF